MQHKIALGPSYAILAVGLAEGEEIRCETGAMVSMSGTLALGARMNAGGAAGEDKGVFGRIGRAVKSVLAGEDFFISTIKAERGADEAILAPSIPGDIGELALDGETVFLASGAYLASVPAIDVTGSWGGVKSWISGPGLILLKASGTGPLWITSFGALYKRELKAGQTLIVDTGHIVAFDDGMPYELRLAADAGGGGFFRRSFTSAVSGEGFVCEFTGPGRIWIQTRNPAAFVSWLAPQMPAGSSGARSNAAARSGAAEEDSGSDGDADSGGDSGGGDGGK